MNAHRLRYRIELEEPQTTQNDIGAVMTTYQSAGRFWSDKIHKSGSRQFDGDLETQSDRVEYVIRPNPNIKPNWRIRDDGRSFQILSINRMVDRMVLVVDNSTSASTNDNPTP